VPASRGRTGTPHLRLSPAFPTRGRSLIIQSIRFSASRFPTSRPQPSHQPEPQLVSAYRHRSSPRLKTVALVSSGSTPANVLPHPLVYLAVKTVTLDL